MNAPGPIVTSQNAALQMCYRFHYILEKAKEVKDRLVSFPDLGLLKRVAQMILQNI